ncbi:MAG: hypothetical protein OEQ49_06600 [Myxococcales bacterium]|jgi:polyhydroxybutyrate depolymerase|nr:hypothetical protein [Myxococcales bacterium]
MQDRNECVAWLAACIGLLASACGSSGSDTVSVGASLGCADGTLDQSVVHVDLEFGGESRSYELHVPPSYDGNTPMPLLLNFHGFTSNGPQQQFFSEMDGTADERGFVVAYPNGIASSWNGGSCCGAAQAEDIDDVGFARAVIDDIGGRGCIDLSRVYAAGMSNGGFLSHRLACEAADVIAAIGPVAGVLVLDPAKCTPSRPISVIQFYGTEDPLVPYDGGGLAGGLSAPETQAGWAERNGCTGGSTVTYSNGDVTCETIDQCDGNVTVTMCTVEGGGHCWPGQTLCGQILESIDLGRSTTDIIANEAMWDLFETVNLP